jgi:ribosomal-protein-alanine N-acetyltransferase
MSTLDNIRARFPWAVPTGSDTAPIAQMTTADVRHVRFPWTSHLSPERLAAQIESNPDLVLWIPETGEYAVGDNWRNRDDIAYILEATTRRGQARLVGALTERVRQMDYRLIVLPDEVMDAGRKLYTEIGFRHLERVVILRRSLHRLDELPDVSGLPKLEIRRAGIPDLDVLVRADNLSFPWLWWNSRREFEVYHDLPDVHIYMAYLAGDPVGYASFTMYDGWAHLDRIAVVSDKQGKGLGAIQLAYTLRLMARMGASHVALSTQLSNTQSHKLYERFGFSRTGDKMDFYGLKL